MRGGSVSPGGAAALPLPTAILSWTRHWLALDKPSGLPSRPAPGHETSALGLLERWLAANVPGAPRPGVVHRLDLGTSGVLIFSMSPDGHRALVSAFAAGRIGKEYLAIVSGHPRPRRGVIDLPLRRTSSGRVMPDRNGRPSVTRYETVRRFERASLLRVLPATGRMHQIRVHLSARGTPVLGDPLYGPRRIPGGLPAAPRLCLHCARLALPEPMIRELSRLDDSLSAGLTNVVEGAPPDPRVPGETPGPAAAPREGRFLIMAPFPPELTRYLAALTRQPGKV